MNLPVEIVLDILQFSRDDDLRNACLLSKTFNEIAIRRLYECIEIRSRKKPAQIQVIQLFSTLSGCPHLALLVRHLTISGFQKYMSSSSFILGAIRNCINLQSCSWAGVNSLTSEILQELSSCSNLRELEVNGLCDGNYTPDLLLTFKNLEKLSLIMPSASVMKQMPDWLALNSQSIRNLTLTYSYASSLTDTPFDALATLLPNLEYLRLSGCHQLTSHILWPLLLSNVEGLVGLDLDGLSSLFDVEALCLACESQPSHPFLRLRRMALTFVVPLLSVPPTVFSATRLPANVDPKRLLPAIHTLCSHTTLEAFKLYLSSSSCGPSAKRCNFLTSEPAFWQSVVERHSKALKQFSVWGISINSDTVRTICRECVNLEELRVVVVNESTEQLSACLSPSISLRSIQIDFHFLSQPTYDKRLFQFLSADDILLILKRCSFTVAQFGSASKMWEVKRTVVSTHGMKEIKLSLEPL